MTTSPARLPRPVLPVSAAAAPLAAVGAAIAAAALLAACAALPSPGPAVAIPESLRVPAGQAWLRTLDAEGVQVYECRPRAGGGTEWAFIEPEARLFDEAGAPAGRHFAGPSWEAPDGSRVAGIVRAKADAPEAGAIPWLLLATRSTGPDGAFARVTSVQRVATVGGVAPAGGCAPDTIGRTARVPYKAKYLFYTQAG